MAKLKELFEAKVKTKDQVKTADIDLDSPKHNEIAASDKKKNGKPAADKATPDVKLKGAGRDKTRASAAGVNMPPGAADKLARLQATGMQDEISDEEAARNAGADDADTTDGYVEPVPTTPENLPAIINKDIAAAAAVDPEWHQVKHLPGYLSAPIRAMGRQVFAPFTKTKIEDIQVIADLGGGPNTHRELNAVAGFIIKHGRLDTEAQLTAEEILGDYRADVKVYTSHGYTFMLVKDFAGQYIYSWPTSDSRLTAPGVNKRLGHD